MKNSVFGETKTCQMTPLTKMTMKETGRREGVGMLLTKFHIYSLITTSHCAKYTQNFCKRKECSFPFQNSRGFAYFLQQFGRYNFLLIITLHGRKFLVQREKMLK